MRNLPRLGLALSLSVALGISLIGQAAFAASTQAGTTPAAGGRTATLAEVENQVFWKADANAVEQPAANGQTLQVGGSVRTGAKSSVALNLSEGTLIRMKEGSAFTLTALNQDSGNPFTQISMAVGKLWIILSGGTAQVETPAGVAAVRGSYMAVSYNPALNEMKVMCLETKFTCTVIINGVTYELQMGQELSTPPADHPRIDTITHDCGEQREWLAYNPESNQFLDQNCVVIHDQDNDGVPDQLDNCPTEFNSNQLDTDHNGLGNACQPGAPKVEPSPIPTATECSEGGGGEGFQSESSEGCGGCEGEGCGGNEGPTTFVPNSSAIG